VRLYPILYVRDQAASTAFYARLLDASPSLVAPGMTEFSLAGAVALGLMPEAGIRRLLGPSLPDPAAASGIPRAELYLVVDEPEACLERALAGGATALSGLERRSWGDEVAYVLDPDGHVVAIAAPVTRDRERLTSEPTAPP
jgi:uncharacterized glyoxalase superfamily protein PhnB